MNNKTLKIVEIAVGILGLVVPLMSDAISDRKTEMIIEEKIDEKFKEYVKNNN